MIQKRYPLVAIWVLLLFSTTLVSANCPNPNAANLIYKGDFGAGPDQVFPELPFPQIQTPLLYSFTANPSTAKYNLTNSTVGTNPNWIEIGDASANPTGYMMLVNGFIGPISTLSYDLDVCAGETYFISMDVINMVIPTLSNYADPILELRVNGVAVTATQPLSKGTGWQTLGTDYTVPNGTSSISIELYNYSGAVQGNDFAIDNVQVLKCGSDVILTETGNPIHCPGETADFDITTNPILLGTTFYQIQISEDEGYTWTNFSVPTTQSSIAINNLPYAVWTRVLASTDINLLAFPNCSFVSQPYEISFFEPADCFNFPVNAAGLECTGTLGVNLVEEGDFGAGQDAIGPALPPNVSPLFFSADNNLETTAYTIANQWTYNPCIGNTSALCWIQDLADSNGAEDGYFMMVNGGSSTEVIWNQNISLCNDYIHVISFDAINLANTLYGPNNPNNSEQVALPELELVLSPTGSSSELIEVISTPFSTGPILNDGIWHHYSFTFLGNPFQNNFKLSIRAKGQPTLGNDFAIDNIALQFCGPEIEISGPTFACAGESIELEAILSNTLLSDQFFKWEKSTDGGHTWTILGGAAGSSINTIAEINATYRVKVAYNNFNGLPNDNCFSISDPFELEIYNTGPYLHDVQICSEDYYYLNGDSFNINANLVDTLSAFNGCDSIVHVSLSVLPQNTTILTENLCSGESVFFAGEEKTDAGIYFDTLTSYIGCDSILFLSIIELDSSLTMQEIVLCHGETYFGQSFTHDTTFYQVETNYQGCDSTIATAIKVSTLDTFDIYGPMRICAGPFGSTTLSVDTYTEYKWSNGSLQQSSTFSQAGNYAVTVTDELGCTADQVFNIPFIELTMAIESTHPICHNDSTGQINIVQVSGGAEPYFYSINGGTDYSSNPSFNQLSAEDPIYEIFVADSNDCFISEVITLTNPDTFYIDLGPDLEINLGEEVQLTASSNQSVFDIIWSPIDSVDCSNCQDVIVQPTVDMLYGVYAINEDGCEAYDEIYLDIGKERPVFTPNIFSPDGDGFNNFFTIYAGVGVEYIANLEIADRWGNIVYQSNDFYDNILSTGWDGKLNNVPCAAGVYAYKFVAYFTDGVIRTYEGSVTLLR